MYGEFRTERPWLQTCLKNITAGAPFPGRKEDFDSEAAWQYWKTLETAHLSQLMVILVQFNPELAKSTPSDNLPTRPGARPGSMYDRAQRNGSVSSRKSILSLAKDMSDLDLAGIGEDDVDVDGDDEVQVGHNFTYIPPNPKKYYRRLLEYCLEADLRAMRDPNVNDDDQVSLGILSPGHIELINECALRWRIPQPYRVACFLELIKELYERNEVPLDCIPEALSNVQKVMHEIEFDKWPIADVSSFRVRVLWWYANVSRHCWGFQSEYLVGVYGGLYNIFLAALYHSMDSIPNLKKSDVEEPLMILDLVRETGLLERFDVDIQARLEDIRERVRAVTAEWYEKKMAGLQETPGVNRALPLLLITDDLEKSAQTLDKRFPEPILGCVSFLPSHFS